MSLDTKTIKALDDCQKRGDAGRAAYYRTLATAGDPYGRLALSSNRTWPVGWPIPMPKRSRSDIATHLRRPVDEDQRRPDAIRLRSSVIDRVLRWRLLDATAGVIGLVASGTTGLLKDVVVWLTSEADQEAPGR